jgi:hypothetical protein
MPSSLLDTCRTAARLAGPAAVLALVLFFVALAVHGDDVGAIARGPLGATANALALVSLLLLLAGLVRLAARPELARSPWAVLLAGAGTVLAAGGAWTQLVLLPVLAVEAPRVANEGAGLLTAGYVVSFLLAGIGWLLVAVRLRHDGDLSRGRVRLLLVGALLMLSPLPTRWFLLAVAVSLLAAPQPVASPRRTAVPATG